MKLLNLDHTAVAVRDLDAAIAGYEDRYRVTPLYRETVESQGVEEAMIPLGGSFIQLVSPLSPGSPVGRFLDKHGEGLHHVAFHAPSRDDVDGLYERLKSLGSKILDPPAEYPQYAPGYYAGGFFADPDGLKLEFVHMPNPPVVAAQPL